MHDLPAPRISPSHRRSAFNHRLLVCCVWAVIAGWPATPAAQQPAFADALVEFTAAIEGTYGDEGARIGRALDRMSRALAEWDREIEALESRVTSQTPPAPKRTDAAMHVTLARVYAARGRAADALREIETAIHIDPMLADAHVLRGLLLEGLGRGAQAGEAFRAAWAVAPRDPIKAYYALRHAPFGREGDLQHALDTMVSAYRTLLQDKTTAAAPFERIGRPSIGSESTPVLPLAAYAAGFRLLARGEYEAAIAEFRRAAAHDPLIADPAAQTAPMLQAAAALREGRLAEARSLLEASSSLRASSEAHRLLGFTYWAASHDDRSIEQLEAAVRVNPRDERSRIALSRVLSSTGRHADAERALQDARVALPDSVVARWWLGWAHQRVNRFAEARREFEYASAGAIGGHSGLHVAIGRLAAQAADFAGASEAFAQAVRANPNDGAAHVALAGALLPQDRADDAFVELVAALMIDPADAVAHSTIGQIHLDNGRYEDAANALRRALELSPNQTETRYALATALMRAGKTRDAEREFALVVRAQGSMLDERRRSLSLDVLKEEAALRAAEGHHDRAAALWQEVIAREAGRPLNHLGLARALASGGRIDRAIEEYEKAAALGADSSVYRYLAELYTKAGRTLDASRAAAMYNRALHDDTGRGSPR